VNSFIRSFISLFGMLFSPIATLYHTNSQINDPNLSFPSPPKNQINNNNNKIPGGPLIDVESGRVIGINAAIRAHMEGTSFAIPINRVRDIMHDLSNGKEIRHGYLGCQLTTCTPDWARENNGDNNANSNSNPAVSGIINNNEIPEVYGALVHKIYGKSPVHLGGLKEQDIIQQIGLEPVKSASDASRLIDLAAPGENIPFTILRNGSVKIINVKPKDMSSTQRDLQREKQKRLQDEKHRFQELGPFRSLLRD
jgi:S1-C subfamily serine protease